MFNLFLSKNFLKYFIIGVFSTIASTILLIVMVDYFRLWVGLANPIVVFIIFTSRYLVYNKVGLISK